MKKILLFLALAFTSAALSAQNPYIEPTVATENGAGLTLPHSQTVLAVDLHIEQEQIIAGPYARYAQKFLGVLAPLADRNLWSIKSAAIGIMDPARVGVVADPACPSVNNVRYASSDEGFPTMPIDKASMSVATLEESAGTAARMIYQLRSRRVELITGEAGEHVFGEGLKAALDEIARLEQGYLELFLGKKIIRTATYRMLVYPRADKKQYVVCRFNEQNGILAENDLSGDMVLLQIEPGKVDRSMAAGEKAKSVVECRVAAYSNCVVSVGARECGRSVLPILEFGEKMMLPLRQAR